MQFNEQEVRDIIAAHAVEKWGVAASKIKQVSFSTEQRECDNKPHLIATVDVETDRGGPYREGG